MEGYLSLLDLKAIEAIKNLIDFSDFFEFTNSSEIADWVRSTISIVVLMFMLAIFAKDWQGYSKIDAKSNNKIKNDND
jgi:hypothetical protein